MIENRAHFNKQLSRTPDRDYRSRVEETVRAFIAIAIDPKIVKRLAEFQRELNANLPRGAVRWVEPEQMHLTLKFFRHVETARIEELCMALDRACEGAKSFELRVSGLGLFPNEKRPRVLWAGLEGGLDALKTLHERIENATCGFCDEEEHREWRPHLTLGRVTKPLRNFHAAASVADFGAWKINAVDLLRSELTSRGALHTRLASVELNHDIS